MITTTSEGRAGLSEQEFSRRISTASGAIWKTVGGFLTANFRAAHHAPSYRHCSCGGTGK